MSAVQLQLSVQVPRSSSFKHDRSVDLSVKLLLVLVNTVNPDNFIEICDQDFCSLVDICLEVGPPLRGEDSVFLCRRCLLHRL
jgi:hypothetical protein